MEQPEPSPDPGPDTRRAESLLRDLLRTAAPPGTTIGPYRVIDEIERGGMGVVYRAETAGSPPIRVALKVMRPGLLDDHAQQRFEFEAMALAAMDHEAIAKVHGAGRSAAGDPYLAMELVHGVPLTQFCDAHELPIAGRLQLFQRICAGVEHAHRRGVIHRDLKPGNVLVADRDGAPIPKIIDFGIARAIDRAPSPGAAVTEPGVVQGTREYMSPEQAAGRTAAIDTRTDVYALGVMLHELLTGELPFPSERLRHLGWAEFERVLHEEPPPRPSATLLRRQAGERAAARGMSVAALTGELRRDLDWVVLKATAKEPELRYPSPTALADDIARYLDGRPVLAGPPSVGYRIRKFVRRHRWATIAVGALGASLLATVSATVEAAAAERTSTAIREQLTTIESALGVDEMLRAVTVEAIPETPAQGAMLRRWLEAAQVAKERLPVLLRDLRSRGRFADSLPNTWVSLASDRLESALDGPLGEGSGSQMARVRRGLEWAETVTARTCVAYADAWHECTTRVAADPRFGGLQLAPQPGLVPLGRDPASGLEEFAFLRSGTVPTREAATHQLALDASSAIVLVLLPGAEFTLGARSSDAGARANELPLTAVRLDPFFIGKHEVSQGQWQRLDDGRNPAANPPNLSPNAPAELRIVTLQHPIESVTWFEAWHLMKRMGLGLPTEAQWEYAARGGTETAWWTGEDFASVHGGAGRLPAGNIADQRLWEFPPSNKDTPFAKDFDDGFVPHAPIGSFRPNPFGLHDVIGNVREWVLDEPAPYGDGIESGTGQLRGRRPDLRGSRGGAWTQGPAFSRVAHRETVVATFKLGSTGVRATRAIDR
ncbi:MAG: SUMF1/EgtB/PvdO family nonheme iron enzyme [Planctomycetes bacterium]|nr:SUMF1/EgtB/PvdO family nonheme iron enzyme [Planctomycetota bacterium]